MIPINIIESINKKRIVLYSGYFISAFEKITRNLFLFFPLLIIPFLIIQNAKNVFWQLFFATIILLLIIAWFYMFLYSKKLKTIKAKSKHNNRFDVLKYSKSKKWKIVENRTNFIKVVLHKKYSGIFLRRYVFIFFSKDKILINCSTTSSNDFIFPFHWFGNKEIERNFIKDFKLNEKQHSKSSTSTNISSLVKQRKDN